MTAKQALIERVQDMTEEEASELLAQLEWNAAEFEELTAPELARVERGEAQVARGESIDGEALFRELGI